jgi:hypothetical protein
VETLQAFGALFQIPHYYRKFLHCKSKMLCPVASNKFWSSMSFQNFVRLSQIKKKSLPDYAQSVKKMRKKLQLMSYDMMIGYDICDCFTLEHFRLRQRMTLTIKM